MEITDDQQWQLASEIENRHPAWLVTWGCYTRLFWAYPLFDVPQGTILSAPGPKRLVADMQTVEAEQRGTRLGTLNGGHVPADGLPCRTRLSPWPAGTADSARAPSSAGAASTADNDASGANRH